MKNIFSDISIFTSCNKGNKGNKGYAKTEENQIIDSEFNKISKLIDNVQIMVGNNFRKKRDNLIETKSSNKRKPVLVNHFHSFANQSISKKDFFNSKSKTKENFLIKDENNCNNLKLQLLNHCNKFASSTKSLNSSTKSSKAIQNNLLKIQLFSNKIPKITRNLENLNTLSTNLITKSKDIVEEKDEYDDYFPKLEQNMKSCENENLKSDHLINNFDSSHSNVIKDNNIINSNNFNKEKEINNELLENNENMKNEKPEFNNHNISNEKKNEKTIKFNFNSKTIYEKNYKSYKRFLTGIIEKNQKEVKPFITEIKNENENIREDDENNSCRYNIYQNCESKSNNSKYTNSDKNENEESKILINFKYRKISDDKYNRLETNNVNKFLEESNRINSKNQESYNFNSKISNGDQILSNNNSYLEYLKSVNLPLSTEESSDIKSLKTSLENNVLSQKSKLSKYNNYKDLSSKIIKTGKFDKLDKIDISKIGKKGKVRFSIKNDDLTHLKLVKNNSNLSNKSITTHFNLIDSLNKNLDFNEKGFDNFTKKLNSHNKSVNNLESRTKSNIIFQKENSSYIVDKSRDLLQELKELKIQPIQSSILSKIENLNGKKVFNEIDKIINTSTDAVFKYKEMFEKKFGKFSYLNDNFVKNKGISKHSYTNNDSLSKYNSAKDIKISYQKYLLIRDYINNDLYLLNDDKSTKVVEILDKTMATKKSILKLLDK